MKESSICYNLVLIVVITSLLFSACKSPRQEVAGYRDQLFNAGWYFIRDSLTGAEQPGYDDSGWRIVDLPHDWSIEDLPGDDGADQIGPFSTQSPGSGRATGHTIGGTGWYRKHFTIDKADAGKTAVLRFDGVYMEAEVWVNGQPAGVHKYGYTPFWFDITSLLNPAGQVNVVAVKVDNIGRNTRWYTGSGIYRNVYLTLTDPVHVDVWGVYVTTPEIDDEVAVADFTTTVVNDGGAETDVLATIMVTDPNGSFVGETMQTITVEARSSETVNVQIPVGDPDLWSPGSPSLYNAEITLEANNVITDRYEQSFGIRSISFSAGEGFLLNGTPLLLKGGSLHHDNGLLGSAAFNRAEERRVEIMKANGYNAIRCAHNPPSEAFLNACDRLGMLVIDEFTDIWEAPKNPQDYSRFFREWWNQDLTNMILRDRNHPSVIMWGIGNEILEKNDSSGLRIGKQLADRVRELDPTRPVTEAINDNWQRRGLEWDKTAPAFALLDVGGYNYEWIWMEQDHEKYPDRVMYGSESFPLEAFEYWQPVEQYPYVVGDFVWTGMDYLGEVALGRSRYVSAQPQSSTPNAFTLASRPSNWPWFGAWCGDIDITGEKKPQKLYRDVLWDISPLEINVHAPVPEGLTERVSQWGWPDEGPGWTWPGSEGKPLEVRIFTKAEKVKLELNGQVIGEKNVSAETKYIAVFEVPYEPGQLKATAYENDNEMAVKVLITANEPAGIRLVADRNSIRADRNDLAFVSIEVVDDQGRVVPRDSVLISLNLSGDGELAASGNASPYDMGSVNRMEVNTFKGRAQAIVRPFSRQGRITVEAGAHGLKPGQISIRVE